MVRQWISLAPVTTFVYDAADQLLSVTDPLGRTTGYTYDDMGRQLTETLPDPDGAGPLAAPFTLHAYNEAGELASKTTALGTTSYEYDALGRMTKVTMPDPDGGGPLLAAWMVYEYDLMGRMTSETNRLGHTTQFEYDNLGRLIKTIDAEAGEAGYSYDAKGNRLTLTDPVNNTTTWVYDGLDRVISETNSLNQTRSFEYDAAGNVTQFTDRNGRVSTYDYDNLQRRTTETWIDGATPLREFSYSYDAASQLIAASDPAASFAFTFDDLGRNTTVAHALAALSFDVVVDHAYDPLGRRTSLSVEIDNTADLINEYQYDYLSRITRITQAGQSGGNAVAEKRVDFEYDLVFKKLKNRFAEITRYADLAGSEPVAVSSFDYDFAGRLTGIDHRDSASVLLAGYSLSYDEGNRLTEFLVAGYSAEDAVYSYDDTDQLIGVDRDGTANDESYTYDENGNRIGGGYSGGGNNQLLSDGTYNYTYDDEGNRLTKTSIATGETVEYSWDHRNRLTAIVTKDDLGVITHEVQYTYDIFNRRIVKTIDADGPGPGNPTQEIYIYDGLREERGSAGDHILLRFDDSENVTGRYLHGPNVDQILVGEDVTSPTVEGDVLWALTDHLGTVRDLAEYDAVSGDTTVVNHIIYDAFGRIVSESNSAIDFLYGFTGRERDTESDLQYNRARYYDAAVGRWISQDPIGFSAGDANLYRYVGNAPTPKTDPSGLDELPMTTVEGYDGQHYEVRDNYFAIGVGYVGAYVFWPLTNSGPKVNAPPTQTLFSDSQTRQRTHYKIVSEGGNFNSRICPSQPVPPTQQMQIRMMAEGYYTFLSSGGDMVLAVTPIVIVPKWRIYSAGDAAIRHGCEEVADQILGVLGRGNRQILRPTRGNVLPKAKAPGDAAYSTFNWFEHTVVVDDARVYDAMTGFQGLPIDEYKALWEFADEIDWPF